MPDIVDSCAGSRRCLLLVIIVVYAVSTVLAVMAIPLLLLFPTEVMPKNPTTTMLRTESMRKFGTSVYETVLRSYKGGMILLCMRLKARYLPGFWH